MQEKQRKLKLMRERAQRDEFGNSSRQVQSIHPVEKDELRDKGGREKSLVKGERSALSPPKHVTQNVMY